MANTNGPQGPPSGASGPYAPMSVGIKVRSVQRKDMPQLYKLHGELFPIVYDDVYYKEIEYGNLLAFVATTTRGVALSLATTHPQRSTKPVHSYDEFPESDDGEPAAAGGLVRSRVISENQIPEAPPARDRAPASESRGAIDDPDTSDELVVGFIVLCMLDEETLATDMPLPYDPNLLAWSMTDDLLSYVMTLGVVSQFRRKGIASKLLEVATVAAKMRPACKAIYLHVLSTNTAAVRFYEKHGYSYVRLLKKCYTIDGAYAEGLLYIKYTNGGRPPYLHRLWEYAKQLMGQLAQPLRPAAPPIV